MIVQRPRKSPRCTIKGTNIIIKAKDCVLIRHSDFSKPPAVAKVEKIDHGKRCGEVKCANVKFHVRWYYRPEDSIGGRRKFHGSKELFLSNHYDIVSGDMIEGKCTVHKIKRYSKLAVVGKNDFYCRLEYDYLTGLFKPYKIPVFCKCEMPFNPDDVMIRCEGCKEWFHPACIGMTLEEAENIEHFPCGTCSSKEHEKLQITHGSKYRDIKGIDSSEEVGYENNEIEALNVLEVGMKRTGMTHNSTIQIWRRKHTNDDDGVLGAVRGPEQAIVSDNLHDEDVGKENQICCGASVKRCLNHVNHNANVEENGGHADCDAPGLEKNITFHTSVDFWHGFPVGERIADMMRKVEKEHPDFFKYVQCASGKRVVQDLSMLANHLEHLYNDNSQMQELSEDVLQIMWDELQDLEHDGFHLSWAFQKITRARILHRSSKLQHLQELESSLLDETAEAEDKVDEAKEWLKSLEMQVIAVRQEIDEVRADLSYMTGLY